MQSERISTNALKKKRESIMKVSEFKTFVREISREKFHENYIYSRRCVQSW